VANPIPEKYPGYFAGRKSHKVFFCRIIEPEKGAGVKTTQDAAFIYANRRHSSHIITRLKHFYYFY
jgi:hypothetical protein